MCLCVSDLVARAYLDNTKFITQGEDLFGHSISMFLFFNHKLFVLGVCTERREVERMGGTAAAANVPAHTHVL